MLRSLLKRLVSWRKRASAGPQPAADDSARRSEPQTNVRADVPPVHAAAGHDARFDSQKQTVNVPPKDEARQRTAVVGPIVGIDLGTTKSVVAAVVEGKIRVIPNQEGSTTTPSVVAFIGPVEILVGESARRQAAINPTRTVFSIKRLMGRSGGRLQAADTHRPGWPATASDLTRVLIDGRNYTPQEITALILRKLKQAAEADLGREVRHAVITAPAYFDNAQRQATLEAAHIAGFDTEWDIEDPATGKMERKRMRIINEPTAACLAHGLDRRRNARVAVLHLGGGTFDVSIVDVEDGVFEVRAVAGDTDLGGDDFDTVLANDLAEHFRRETGYDPRGDPVAQRRLREAAEQAKKDLSAVTAVEVHLLALATVAGVAHDLRVELTRDRFEQLVVHLVERCQGPVLQALRDAHYGAADIDEVLLVGGTTRMPAVRALFGKIFNKPLREGINADEAVAVGAAIQGAQLLLGCKAEVLLLDVTALSLGIETQGGVMTKLIEKNTTIPTIHRMTFSTAEDNQTVVTVQVYQGERPMAADNRLLGRFNLEGIRPAPRGVPQIDVTFDLDANGILRVSARDRNSGKENRVILDSPACLGPAELARLRWQGTVQSAPLSPTHPGRDLRQEARELAADVQNLLDLCADRLGEADLLPIRALLERLQDQIVKNDPEALSRIIEEVDWAVEGMVTYLASGLPTEAVRLRLPSRWRGRASQHIRAT